MAYRVVRREYADGHVIFAIQTQSIRGWWDVEGFTSYTDSDAALRMQKYLTLTKEEVVE